MTIGYCHVKARDFRMTSGFLITMGGTLNLHKILDTTISSLPNAIARVRNGISSLPNGIARVRNGIARVPNGIARVRNIKRGQSRKIIPFAYQAIGHRQE